VQKKKSEKRSDTEENLTAFSSNRYNRKPECVHKFFIVSHLAVRHCHGFARGKLALSAANLQTDNRQHWVGEEKKENKKINPAAAAKPGQCTPAPDWYGAIPGLSWRQTPKTRGMPCTPPGMVAKSQAPYQPETTLSAAPGPLPAESRRQGRPKHYRISFFLLFFPVSKKGCHGNLH
jgi:hypothetical protein